MTNSIMKSFRRILLHHRNLSSSRFLPSKGHRTATNILSKLPINLDCCSDYPFQMLGIRRMINHTQKACCSPRLNFGHSRAVSRFFNLCATENRDVSVIAGFASEFRGFSTSAKTCVDENNFERIYVQGGINVKPLVAEVIGGDENIVEEQESSLKVGGENEINEKPGGLNVSEDVSPKSRVEETDAEKEAWKLLQDAVVTYCGNPVGTVAANDPGDKQPLNYDQVFLRDFIPSALAFLLRGEKEIVKNFLLHTLQLQSWEKTVDCYSPGQGLMPASFKVRTVPLDEEKYEEVLDPDFGESAIGRVAPVDSGLWWIILLRAYGKLTGDYSLQERVDVQTGLKMILNLCLTDGFDMFPSLLVTDGSCMIDRRMGIHGHPLEIQALFYSALRCSREILAIDDGSKNLVRAINNRLTALSFHIREYYWVDMKKVNEIYRYKTEEYSMDAINKFNIYPDQIPSWLMDWIPEAGGYLIGNLQPAHMDFRFFMLGNVWSIVSSLGTPKQNEAILNLIEIKWDDLVGHMPLKICYPALEYEEWRIITGSDPKNTPWSYHNGGSWPTLLWQFTLACIKMEISGLRIGLVFQSAALFDSLTVRENVGFLLYEHSRMSEDQISELVEESLAAVGLKGVEDRLPSELSGGMKKRVALARSIIYDTTNNSIEPEVLLYDEPTAGLDPIASTVVEDLIRSIHIKGRDALGKPGKIASYVVVTHQHSTIKRAIDRLLFLHKGKIVWEGMTHEFTTSTNPIVQQFASGSLDGPIKY